MLATVMQIESCGWQQAQSYAGAMGLFQVMPFHFKDGENMADPDTNARRGAGVLNECLGYADGDVGLAMACYNGGPGVLYQSRALWDGQSARRTTNGERAFIRTHSRTADIVQRWRSGYAQEDSACVTKPRKRYPNFMGWGDGVTMPHHLPS
ncbi:MAG UNVERIFIED_CONTAM: lytic transglycosylase domain-containing protein [Anaerolineae bacterium]